MLFLSYPIFSVAKKSPFKSVEPTDDESGPLDELPSMASFSPRKSSSAPTDPTPTPSKSQNPAVGRKKGTLSDAPGEGNSSGPATSKSAAAVGKEKKSLKDHALDLKDFLNPKKPIEVLVEEDDIYVIDPRSNVESSVWLVVQNRK